MSEMTQYLCAWAHKPDGNNIVLKQGQDAVRDWLFALLREAGIGCPAEVAEHLNTLDADTGKDAFPVQIVWPDGPCTFSITQVTHWGAAASPVPDAAAIRAIVKECRTAWNWLNYIRFPEEPTSKAKKSLGVALCLLGATGHV